LKNLISHERPSLTLEAGPHEHTPSEKPSPPRDAKANGFAPLAEGCVEPVAEHGKTSVPSGLTFSSIGPKSLRRRGTSPRLFETNGQKTMLRFRDRMALDIPTSEYASQKYQAGSR